MRLNEQSEVCDSFVGLGGQERAHDFRHDDHDASMSTMNTLIEVVIVPIVPSCPS